MISPVFFTMERAPLLLRLLGHVSPLRYAADGIMASFSGSADVWSELAILIAFAVVTLSLRPMEAPLARGVTGRPVDLGGIGPFCGLIAY